MFNMAFDDVNAIESAGPGAFPKSGDLTVDQKLKVTEIKALLSISEELSRIHHEGINPDYENNP